MLLTDDHLAEIKQIVLDYHNAFIINAISPSILTPDIITRLEGLGLVNIQINSVEDAYTFGWLLSQLENPVVAKLSYSQFIEFIKKNPIPLSPKEKHAVRIAKQGAGQYVQALGAKVSLGVVNLALDTESKLRLFQGVVSTKTEEAIGKRQSAQQLASAIGNATKAWDQDLLRIAHTELQNAGQLAIAERYKERFGPEVMISRIPMSGACEHCKRVFLGSDGFPLIFKLSDLQANGNNVGRKAKDWLPVCGTVHPNCMCVSARIPKGFGFDENRELVPDGKYGMKATVQDLLKATGAEVTPMVGGETSLEIGRNPNHGTAPNFLFNGPARTPIELDTVVFDEMLEDLELEEEGEEARKRRRRDKRTYDVGVPVPDRCFDLTIPNDKSYAKMDDGRNKERQQKLKDFDARNSSVVSKDNPKFVIKVR